MSSLHPTRKLAVLAAASLMALAAPASASSFTSLTIFGDSLSDTGNIFLATRGTVPAAPYFAGRFSDGPIWVDVLAAGLGFTATPALAGGNNFAFGGARTGVGGSPPGLLSQIGGLWAPANPFADATGLYVLVGGGNDMRDARSAFSGVSAADDAGRQAAANAAVGNLATGLAFLASAGAKNVLISNLPDLGRSVEATLLGVNAASTDATERFNAGVAGLMGYGASLGLHMSFLDMAGVMDDIFVDATTNGGAVYGITNVTAPCNGFPGSAELGGTSCAVSGFSDALHPSAAAHRAIGMAAIAAVPEPETYALMALGLVAVGFAARHRQQPKA